MRLSLRRVLIILLAITGIWSLISNRVFSGKSHIITWDAYGYYLYLPAALKYQDFSEFTFVQEHLQKYRPSDSSYQIFEKDGVKTPNYTMGLAILWLPFYLIAEVWAQLDPRFPADGLSQPYEWMVILAALFWLTLGLIWLSRFLSHYLQESTTWIVLSILVLCTNLFHYVVSDPGMPHVYLFALYSGLLLLLQRMGSDPTRPQGVLLGACLAVMALCRPSEALATILVVCWLWMNEGGWTGLLRHLRSNVQVYALAILTGLIVIAPQILVWKWTTGQWIYNTYAEYGHKFDLLAPHLIDGLFSYRKGWLIYTPVMLLAIAGLFLLRKRTPRWEPGILLFVVANIYIVLSWHIWWYAGSFGMRALVQSYAVLALPLGLAWEAWSGTTWRRSLIPAFVVLCGLLNLFQTWQMHRGILKADEMNNAYYWEAFGRLDPDRSMLRLLDVPDRPDKPALYADLIAMQSAEKDTTGTTEWVQNKPGWLVKGTDKYSPTIRIDITDSLAREWSGQWLKLQSSVLVGEDTSPGYSGAILVFQLQQKDGPGIWHGMQIARLVEIDRWWPVEYEVQLPENLKAGDSIIAVIWVPDSQDNLWMNEIRLSRLFF
ncbi:MAG: hypothetical protein K9I85_15430 [Saprospiraceae bacterium]|nr:hypothetical protein [Saprospiraceae bacterium]